MSWPSPIWGGSVLPKTICAVLIVIVTKGAAFAQADLKNIQGGQNSLRSEQEKTLLIATTNRRSKGFQFNTNINLIRGAMFARLRQRRPRTSNNSTLTGRQNAN